DPPTSHEGAALAIAECPQTVAQAVPVLDGSGHASADAILRGPVPEDLDEPIVVLHRNHVVGVLGSHALEEQPVGLQGLDGGRGVGHACSMRAGGWSGAAGRPRPVRRARWFAARSGLNANGGLCWCIGSRLTES